MDKLKAVYAQYKPNNAKQWILASCIGLTISTTVLIGTLCVRAKKISKLQRQELPSDDELSAIDGAYFVRPSDGKKMEYFSINPGKGKNAIILFHGSAGTGYGFTHWRRDKIQSILEKNNIQLICPSMPGHGASEPMRLENANKILNNVTNDVISLIHQLDAQEVYTMGVSYGVEPAFYLAQNIMKSVKNIKVNGIASICGAPWSTKTFDTTDSMNRGFIINLITNIMMNSLFTEAMAIYLISSMMGENMIQQSAPKEFIENYSDVIPNLTKDILRGFKYFYDALIEPTKLFCQRVNDINTDYAYFNDKKDIVVHFHYGDKDTDVPMTSRKYIMDSIKTGTLFEYKGTHLEVPLVKAIQKMIDNDQ